jgi:hypothetical protein
VSGGDRERQHRLLQHQSMYLPLLICVARRKEMSVLAL